MLYEIFVQVKGLEKISYGIVEATEEQAWYLAYQYAMETYESAYTEFFQYHGDLFDNVEFWIE